LHSSRVRPAVRWRGGWDRDCAIRRLSDEAKASAPRWFCCSFVVSFGVAAACTLPWHGAHGPLEAGAAFAIGGAVGGGLQAISLASVARFEPQLSGLTDGGPLAGNLLAFVTAGVVGKVLLRQARRRPGARPERALALTGIGLTLAAALLGGSQAPLMVQQGTRAWLGLDFFVLNLLLYSVVFIPLERLFALRGAQPVFRRHWLVDLTYFFVNSLLIEVLTIMTLQPALILFDWARLTAVSHTIASLPLVVQVPAIILIAVFTQYWVHRTGGAFNQCAVSSPRRRFITGTTAPTPEAVDKNFAATPRSGTSCSAPITSRIAGRAVTV
jgi:hypothetical protein